MDSENKDNKSAAWAEYPVAANVGGTTHVCISPLAGGSCESHAGHPVNWCASCITRLRASRDEFRGQWAHAQECVRRLPEVEAERDALSFACGMHESSLNFANAMLATTREALARIRTFLEESGSGVMISTDRLEGLLLGEESTQ